MRLRQVWSVLILLAGAGLLASEGAYAKDVPSILWSRHDPSKAAWVSLERATLPNGQIDWNLFGEMESFFLRRGLENHKGTGCVSIGHLRKEIIGSRGANDLRSLVKNSFAIFQGTVVARGIGIADGNPATLLEVRVDETIKGSSEFSKEKTLYIAYPVAEFSVNGIRICKSDEFLAAVPPQVGDSVLVFPLSSPLNEDLNLIYPYSQEVIIQKREGALWLPAKWAKDPQLEDASNLREVITTVKSYEKPCVDKSSREESR